MGKIFCNCKCVHQKEGVCSFLTCTAGDIQNSAKYLCVACSDADIDEDDEDMLSVIEEDDPALMMALENAMELGKNVAGVLTEGEIIYYLI